MPASVSRTRYGLDGNVLATIDPLGNYTSYRFDRLGRLVETIDPAPGGQEPDAEVLAAHWRMEEGAGNKTADESESDLDATLQGGAAWSLGHVGGQAIDLDGTNDWLDLGTDLRDAVDEAAEVTIAGWFSNSDLSGVQALFSSRINGSTSGLSLRLDGNTVVAGARSAAGDSEQPD